MKFATALIASASAKMYDQMNADELLVNLESTHHYAQ